MHCLGPLIKYFFRRAQLKGMYKLLDRLNVGTLRELRTKVREWSPMVESEGARYGDLYAHEHKVLG